MSWTEAEWQRSSKPGRSKKVQTSQAGEVTITSSKSEEIDLIKRQVQFISMLEASKIAETMSA